MPISCYNYKNKLSLSISNRAIDEHACQWLGAPATRIEDLAMNISDPVKRLFDATPVPMVVSRPDGSFEYANPALMAMLGYEGEEIYAPDVIISHPDDLAANRQIREQLITSPFQPITLEKRYVHKDGSMIPGLLTLVAQPDSQGRVLRHIAQIVDLSQQKKADQDALLLKHLLELSDDAIYVVDPPSGRILDCNQLAYSRLGYHKEELLKLRATDLNRDYPTGEGWRHYVDTLKQQGHIIRQAWHTRRDGTKIPVEGNISYVTQAGHAYLVAIVRDVSFRQAQERQIWQQANYDPLTNLPNRRLLQDRLNQAILSDKRTGMKSAVMFLDLDHFKAVNDRFGHRAGDLLLVEAAGRIRDCIRESDTVARQGGDEFVILLIDIEDTRTIAPIAQKIIDALKKPFQLGDHQARVGASIGIALYPDDGQEQEHLLNASDQAMYAAKESGNSSYQFFTHEIMNNNVKRSLITRDIHTALARDEFFLLYQPVVDLATGEVVKAEALLRWRHPGYGVIYPNEFIPLAESTGQINEIGHWVFYQALQQVCQWRRHRHSFQISVNISPVQLKGSQLKLSQWPDLLKLLNSPASAMALEITEREIMDPKRLLLTTIHSLQQAGICLHLDHFGEGFSSLAYLKQFNVDCIKLDARLVNNIGRDPDSDMLCQAMIAMAHQLQLKVVAENVETQAQKEFLLTNQCDYGQGFLLHEPLTAQQFTALLQEN